MYKKMITIYFVGISILFFIMDLFNYNDTFYGYGFYAIIFLAAISFGILNALGLYRKILNPFMLSVGASLLSLSFVLISGNGVLRLIDVVGVFVFCFIVYFIFFFSLKFKESLLPSYSTLFVLPWSLFFAYLYISNINLLGELAPVFSPIIFVLTVIVLFACFFKNSAQHVKIIVYFWFFVSFLFSTFITFPYEDLVALNPLSEKSFLLVFYGAMSLSFALSMLFSSTSLFIAQANSSSTSKSFTQIIKSKYVKINIPKYLRVVMILISLGLFYYILNYYEHDDYGIYVLLASLSSFNKFLNSGDQF